jgi:hypothetical protein
MSLIRMRKMMLAGALGICMLLSSGCLVLTFTKNPTLGGPGTATETYGTEPMSFERVSQATLRVLRERNMAADVEPPDRTPPGEMIIHTRDARGGDIRIKVRKVKDRSAEITFHVESAEGRELAHELLDQIRREAGR